jgi:multiple antibiotic resistance protein
MDLVMTFFLCFIPMFVAVDPIGILPNFMALTGGLNRLQMRKVLSQSLLTALAVSVVFMVLGKWVLGYLGITVADFMIAGGALLFVFSLKDLTSSGAEERAPLDEGVGAVPIGVPLIAGPGLLTTLLVLVGQYGYLMVSVALTVNLALAGLCLVFSQALSRFLGKTGSRTVGKIANLLLAAIAVMFMRKGLVEILGMVK